VTCLRTRDPAGKAVLDASFDQFQRAPALGEENWAMAAQTTGGPRVYRYAGGGAGTDPVAADNTGRNLRDRDPGAVTPTDQSERPKDLQIASSIRRALLREPGLSANARNIKVITGHGRVVLRGPVRSEQERDQINRLVEVAAGSGSVENNLEIARR
jgi:hyperosmotically inducible periplasmic protein